MQDNTIRVGFIQLRSVLEFHLMKAGFNKNNAQVLARVFSENELSGKTSHGVNRFPEFLESVENGHVDVNAEPVWVKSIRSIEQWDGKLGAGPLNAFRCTDRAMELAQEYGIGCVTLKNTNHWLRGGTYGQRAAEAGFVFIGWSNTKPNMPAWGSHEVKLGNNPLVMAVPGPIAPVVLDMAMSQYSYGKMEIFAKKGEKLPSEGGYDTEGNLTKNPESILKSERTLPAGLWKGSGLALVLDILATLLSGGRSTAEIGQDKDEYGLSQIFIAISLQMTGDGDEAKEIVMNILDDFHTSGTDGSDTIYYPGELPAETRSNNLRDGIPVDKTFWNRYSNKNR